MNFDVVQLLHFTVFSPISYLELCNMVSCCLHFQTFFNAMGFLILKFASRLTFNQYIVSITHLLALSGMVESQFASHFSIILWESYLKKPFHIIQFIAYSIAASGIIAWNVIVSGIVASGFYSTHFDIIMFLALLFASFFFFVS